MPLNALYHQFGAIMDANQNNGAILGNLWNRVTMGDYLQAHLSCPGVRPGVSSYQYIGPEGEYSTCYYKLEYWYAQYGDAF